MTANLEICPRLRLLIVQRRLTHYRIPFFEGVRQQLAANGIDLTLAYGDPTVEEQKKDDAGQINWGVHVATTYALGGRICWQSLGQLVEKSDFVVITQENKLLNNFLLLLGKRRCRVGLWGHGRNFQSANARTGGFAQTIKAALSRRADWWFAYTDISAKIVEDFGYPSGRISVLNNSIDTRALAEGVESARAQPREMLRQHYGLPATATVGLYIGSLYAEKRLDLLLDGAIEIKRNHPEFHLAIVGSGPEMQVLQSRSQKLSWIHILGPRKGREKCELLAAADIILNPGLVGLGILDAFVAGLPMVTTDCALHSPEIAYLRHGVNGLMTEPTATSFAQSVNELLENKAMASELRAGALRSAKMYGLDAMVNNFCAGILEWTQSSRAKVGQR